MKAEEYIQSKQKFCDIKFKEDGYVNIKYDDLTDLMESYAKQSQSEEVEELKDLLFYTHHHIMSQLEDSVIERIEQAIKET